MGLPTLGNLPSFCSLLRTRLPASERGHTELFAGERVEEDIRDKIRGNTVRIRERVRIVAQRNRRKLDEPEDVLALGHLDLAELRNESEVRETLEKSLQVFEHRLVGDGPRRGTELLRCSACDIIRVDFEEQAASDIMLPLEEQLDGNQLVRVMNVHGERLLVVIERGRETVDPIEECTEAVSRQRDRVGELELRALFLGSCHFVVTFLSCNELI